MFDSVGSVTIGLAASHQYTVTESNTASAELVTDKASLIKSIEDNMLACLGPRRKTNIEFKSKTSLTEKILIDNTIEHKQCDDLTLALSNTKCINLVRTWTTHVFDTKCV